ncbi:MAG: metallophosphoesterase [Clostridiaceae bacterium]|jgi:predicted MPP superfamily phosphohydrolase|nr:metallophosphoesterase [Clostridiaceae bacterium]
MKKKRPFGCLYIIIVLIFLGLFWYWQNYGLQTTRIALYYDVLPKGFDGYKIAHISDMHGIEFGRKNSALARRIRDFDPDIVVCTGDMISSHARDGQAFLDFLEEMGDQYPIYMCLGNHEQIAEWKEFESEFDYGYESFISQVKEAGVHILDNRTEILEKNGDKIRISGLALELYHYSRRDEPYADDGLLLRTEYIEEVLGSASGGFNLLLAHNPSYFKEYAEWGADLVLAGHIHGGVIRIPFKGGLLSPEHVFFPEYDAGIFEKDKSRMYVNRGLGNTVINMRLFNRPELTEITLKAEP